GILSALVEDRNHEVHVAARRYRQVIRCQLLAQGEVEDTNRDTGGIVVVLVIDSRIVLAILINDVVLDRILIIVAVGSAVHIRRWRRAGIVVVVSLRNLAQVL